MVQGLFAGLGGGNRGDRKCNDGRLRCSQQPGELNFSEWGWWTTQISDLRIHALENHFRRSLKPLLALTVLWQIVADPVNHRAEFFLAPPVVRQAERMGDSPQCRRPADIDV